MRPQYDKDRKEHHRFYASQPWRRLRAKKLLADPICEGCRRELAVDVHHIIDRVLRPDLALAWDNLQSLGHACHSRITASRRKGGGGQI